jgi:hypothetical protein
LPAVIRNLRQLKPLFREFQILFFYDRSDDNTLEILKAFQSEDPAHIIIIENQTPVFGDKLAKIAFARNGILRIIRDQFADYEYFAMMDTNEYSCIGELNLDVLAEVFSADIIQQWDSVSFDREAGYYDYWALSFHPFVYSFFHFKFNVRMQDLMKQAFQDGLTRQKATDPTRLIPVYSAFNGFAIYKADRFTDCTYTPVIDLSLFPPGSVEKQINLIPRNQLLNLFTTDCEHRHFHLEAIQKHGARIRIYPKSVFRKVHHPSSDGLRGPA